MTRRCWLAPLALGASSCAIVYDFPYGEEAQGGAPAQSSGSIASTSSEAATSSGDMSSASSSKGGGEPGAGGDDAGGGGAGGGPAPELPWIVGMGSEGDDYIIGSAIDPGGRSALAVQFEGQLSIGTEPEGASLDSGDEIGLAIVVLEADGSLAWALHLGSDDLVDESRHFASLSFGDDGSLLVIGSIPADRDLVFAGGGLSNTGYASVFAVRFDSRGELVAPPTQWGDDDTQLATASHAAADGTFLITGGFCGDLAFEGCALGPVICGNGLDVYLARLDADLNCLWARSWPNSGGQVGYHVHANDRGDILLAGQLSGTLDLGGTAAVIEGPTAGAFGSFVARLDADGSGVFGALVADTPTVVRGFVASDGDVYVAAPLLASPAWHDGPPPAGATDIFLARLAPEGPVWSRFLGGASPDGVDWLRPRPGGARVFAWFAGMASFDEIDLSTPDQDGVLLDIDPDGQVLRAEVVKSATSGETVSDGFTTAAGAEILMGNFGGGDLTLAMPLEPVPNRGNIDAYVLGRAPVPR